ncbi:nitrite reductase (NADH) small subunit [Paenibacillus castaneae]|uniref:nitrite reductase (NAD(P)H) small subunit n=1 Tax=Paenibacillus castaneae TaxID=474957 RepID=UPI000C9AF4B5|nr:nitrite reductase (NAD(P)H) small subunit [Paenibacillus castaneae]NIK78473.1 nitrite reductase (NADH) small subunit [Paenibacillus castaneae]
MEIGTLQDINAIRYYGVGLLDRFGVSIGHTVQVEGNEIAVFRTSDDRLFAIDNMSAHWNGGTLSEGILSGHDLYDPLYVSRINLETGAIYAPSTGQVRIYPICVEGNEVQIGLPA